MRASQIAIVAALAAACGGELQVGTGGATPASSSSAPLPTVAPLAASAPQIELREPGAATVAGQRVTFDGVAEGLAWPALTKALARKAGDTSPVVIQAGREVPVIDLLRATWTFRASDVRLQTLDEKGVMYAVEFKAKPASATTVDPKQCHLAVFLLPSGALRVASPAGPQEVGGDRPAESLARALEAARQSCPIKYIAFGGETNDMPWGRVFDVIVAVDRAKSAGGARYVLGEALHVAPAPSAAPAAPAASGKLGF